MNSPNKVILKLFAVLVVKFCSWFSRCCFWQQRNHYFKISRIPESLLCPATSHSNTNWKCSYSRVVESPSTSSWPFGQISLLLQSQYLWDLPIPFNSHYQVLELITCFCICSYIFLAVLTTFKVPWQRQWVKKKKKKSSQSPCFHSLLLLLKVLSEFFFPGFNQWPRIKWVHQRS